MVHDNGRNPFDFGSQGQRSRSIFPPARESHAFRCLVWLPFVFEFALIHINDYRHYTLLFINIDQISSTATFLCDPDLDYFCSRSLYNFG